MVKIQKFHKEFKRADFSKEKPVLARIYLNSSKEAKSKLQMFRRPSFPEGDMEKYIHSFIKPFNQIKLYSIKYQAEKPNSSVSLPVPKDFSLCNARMNQF